MEIAQKVTHLLPIALILATSACATLSTPTRKGLEKSAVDMYDITQLETRKVVLDIMVVSNIQKGCDAESRRHGLGGFAYSLEGCGFWYEENNMRFCTIMVENKTNNDIIGHETRHCFQGQFHE